MKPLLDVTITPEFEERLLAEIDHENLRAELHAALQPADAQLPSYPPAQEVWPGKGYELARKVRDELGPDWTQPGKFTTALEQACQRYVKKSGKRFTPKSLREGLRQWDEWSKGCHPRQR